MVQINADIFTEIPQTMLILQIGGGVIDGDNNWHAGAFWDNGGLFPHLREYFRVDEFIRESLNEEWELQIFGVRTMEQRHGEGVIEKNWIHAISGIDCHTLQVIN